MIFYFKTILIQKDENIFININNKNIIVDYFFYDKNKNVINDFINNINEYYVLKIVHVNKKQNFEYKYFVFLDFKSINIFNELLKIDFFGIKTIINIIDKDIDYFIECSKKQNVDELKNIFKLNAKQIQCFYKTKLNFINIANKKAIIKENKQILEFKQILNNLGYNKDLVDKVVSQNLNAFENIDTTLKIKKFVEIVKSYAN